MGAAMRCAGGRGLKAAAVAAGLYALPLGLLADPVLYKGDNGWGVLAGFSESDRPPYPDWSKVEGVWIGRMDAAGRTLEKGPWSLSLDDAQSLPLAPGVLPATHNPFGPCVLRSLSVRFDSQIRSRRWSLVFAREGEVPRFESLAFPVGDSLDLTMELEDVVTGRKWALTPVRQGREGSLISTKRGDAVFYAGTVDDGALEWTVLVSGAPGSRRVILGRVVSLEHPLRLLRWRVAVRSGAAGMPLLQDELPPAVVAVASNRAVALFADPSEPRRFRSWDAGADWAGMEFDLAVTRLTGNFPLGATISLDVDAWETTDDAAARQEAVDRLARAGNGTPLPDTLEREGWSSVLVLDPGRMVMTHPGGFRDHSDAWAYLMVRMSGIFSDPGWASSAFLCTAQNAEGEPLVDLQGDQAVAAVNVDPDLETILEIGRNRGMLVHERAVSTKARAIWLRAMGTAPGLDHQPRALHMCDFPAIWEEGASRPGVDLRHAEAELFAVLSCAMKAAGKCLLISDSGPMAPFTTYHADALVCESADFGEMRRQRALAGPRPVVWTPESPSAAAVDLARELAFVRLGKKHQD